MRQQTFSDYEYANRRRKTRREMFLEMMEEIIPWKDWVGMIRPHYPSGKRGRPPKDIETMLRMYLLQNWFLLSGEGIEDAIYDSFAMRSFMQIDFFAEQVPDATTLLRFRQLLERHRIAEKIQKDLNDRLEEKGYVLLTGSVSDAVIVAVPETRSEDENIPKSSGEDNGTSAGSEEIAEECGNADKEEDSKEQGERTEIL